MNLVTLRDVGVAYDGYEALQHVDLEIAKNDFLGVIGPNGGGKTTLVKAILGTVPHTGEVRLAPELFRDKERLIGYMPQLSDFDRTFPISVLEVVLSGLQGHKGIFSRYTKADRAKALGLLETAGVADTARNPIGEVSGGQMQRALPCWPARLARMVDGIGRGHRTDIYGLHDAAASGQGPGRSDERLANSSFPLVRLRLCLQQRPHG